MKSSLPIVALAVVALVALVVLMRRNGGGAPAVSVTGSGPAWLPQFLTGSPAPADYSQPANPRTIRPTSRPMPTTSGTRTG